MENDSVTIPFRGSSMWPHLQSGDDLIVEFFTEPRRLSEFPMGKILLHRDRDEWVAHRLVLFKGRKVLKGDFSNSYTWEEDPIVWGEVRGVRRERRSISWKTLPRFAHWIARLSAWSLSARRWKRRLGKALIFTFYLLGKIGFRHSSTTAVRQQ